MNYKNLGIIIVVFSILLVTGSVSYHYLVVLPQQEEARVEREELKEAEAQRRAEERIKQLQEEIEREELKEAEAQRRAEERIKQLQEEVKKATRAVKYVTTNTNLLELQNHQIIRTIPKGTKVIIIEERADWSHVQIDNQEGWLKSEYLADSIPLTPDLSSIVKQWKPIVGLVECEFRYTDTFRVYERQHGSGIAIKPRNFPLRVITNRHITNNELGFVAYNCKVSLTGHNYIYNSGGNWQNFYKLPYGYDGGIIIISNPDNYIINLTSSFPKLCREKPVKGDEIVILGYPAIGSRESITVTRGIISGFEGKYYITDAKIDQGNSGGAAILLKDNCLLGLPTFVRVGRIEALGRILSISAFFEIKR